MTHTVELVKVDAERQPDGRVNRQHYRIVVWEGAKIVLVEFRYRTHLAHSLASRLAERFHTTVTSVNC